jgi:hypothetical protein
MENHFFVALNEYKFNLEIHFNHNLFHKIDLLYSLKINYFYLEFLNMERIITKQISLM